MIRTSSIYLDHNASTRLSPGVVSAMRPYLESEFANASSTHPAGRRVRAAIERSRMVIRDFIHARSPSEIVFTSGGTEAIQLATALVVREHGPSTWLISAIEHSAVYGATQHWAAHGITVERVPVDRGGLVDLDALRSRLEGDDIGLVAVMGANNETGAIQPVDAIASLCRAHGARYLCDAVQLIGRHAFGVGEHGPDFAALSAHKFGGPKGVGALYVRHDRDRRLKFDEQEWGLCPGTENVAGIVGTAAALEWIATQSIERIARLERAARDTLEMRLHKGVPEAVIFSADAPRLPNTTFIAFPGVNGVCLIELLGDRGVYASAGAACSGRSGAASSVLEAMGVPESLRACAVRYSTGPGTSLAEVEVAADVTIETVRRLSAGGAA